MRILFVEALYKSTEPMSIMLLSSLAKQKSIPWSALKFSDGTPDNPFFWSFSVAAICTWIL